MKCKTVFFLRKAVCIAFVLQGWFCGSSVYAQSNAANAGTEFYITYLHQTYCVGNLQLKVVVEQECYITAQYNQTGTYWNGWNNTLVQPGIYTAAVTYADVVNTATGISNRSITLTASENVCVFSINYCAASTDGTCILPVPAWGTQYRLVTGHTGYQATSCPTYSVVAKENNTVVTLHNNATITLNKNQVYHFYGSTQNDILTGMKVTATNPVALYSGHTIVNSGTTCSLGPSSADHIYEQLWSVDKWGKDFFVMPIATPCSSKDWGGTLCIVANENATNVTISGGIGTTVNYILNEGDYMFVCYLMTELARIVSDKPIMVNITLPDASLMIIPATAQRIQHALVAPFVMTGSSNIQNHRIDLLIPSAYWNQTVIMENNAVVPGNATYTVQTSLDFPDWYHLSKNLSNTNVAIDITCPGGFLAYMSGCGSIEAYGFSVGAGAYDLQNYFTIQEQATTIETYYENTTEITHTFETNDIIVVKRTVETPFDSIRWFINGIQYPIADNTSMMNTLNFPASALNKGENFLTMSVRYQGSASDSLYTGSIWRGTIFLDAKDDYIQILTCYDSIIIDVLANDTMIHCDRNSMVFTITGGSLADATTSVNTNKDIVYARDTNFLGQDTLEYQVECNDTIYTARVFILVAECPDNISDASCYDTPPAQDWTMREIRSTNEVFSTYQIPIVGDVDGDGIPEILVGRDPTGGTGAGAVCSQIAIFKGNNITTPWRTINTTQPFNWFVYTKYGIVKTKIGGIDTVLIVVAERDRYLRAYNYNGGLVWTSSAVYHATNSEVGHDGSAPGFADFNNDGIPEVMIKGKIFNSVNGQLLCSTPTDPLYHYCAPIAADLFNTGKLNFIVGNNIYTPNASLTALTLERTLTFPINPSDLDVGTTTLSQPRPAFTGNASLSGTWCNEGGLASAVDIDNDGKLELIYQHHRTGLGAPNYGEALISVVDPATGAIKASKYIPYAEVCGWPFVGDIDGCGSPEIVFIRNRYNGDTDPQYLKMYAYKYVPGNPILQKFWEYDHTDHSGQTGMTLFDFNQDGISEIVYRDEVNLRIINGSLIHHQTGLSVAAPYNLSTFPNTSGTRAEYPVVADVDGDGQADITIVGGTATQSLVGTLRVYKSLNLSTSPWAPARKVWNQYAYNAANVNENLTIPRFPISPATVFPNGSRPYNNFLQQQTLLSANGSPFWTLPNIIWETAPSATAAGDSITFTGCITNIGDATLQTPIYITLYKNDTLPSNMPGNILAVDTLQTTLMAGDTLCFSLSVKNICSHAPFTSIWISINDSNGIYPYQQQCEIDGRKEITNITFTDTLSASISASDNNVCVGTDITFTANVTNGGSSPTYQWKVNGIDLSGETNSTCTYTPENDDVITCVVTSVNQCVNPNSVTTNEITMIIVPKATPAITIKVSPK